MKQKVLIFLIFAVFVLGAITFLSKHVFGGINCDDCDYAYLYDKYEHYCPWKYDLESINPAGGTCMGTTCHKRYQIVCIDQEAINKGWQGNAHIEYVYEDIYGCCRMTRPPLDDW